MSILTFLLFYKLQVQWRNATGRRKRLIEGVLGQLGECRWYRDEFRDPGCGLRSGFLHYYHVAALGKENENLEWEVEFQDKLIVGAGDLTSKPRYKCGIGSSVLVGEPCPASTHLTNPHSENCVSSHYPPTG